MVGAPGLDFDKYIRALMIDKAVERDILNMKHEDLDLLEAYADGINAYVEEAWMLPPEFQILGVGFEKWTPRDSLRALKFMSFAAACGWQLATLRTGLAELYGRELALELMPYDAPDSFIEQLPIVQDEDLAAMGLAELAKSEPIKKETKPVAHEEKKSGEVPASDSKVRKTPERIASEPAAPANETPKPAAEKKQAEKPTKEPEKAKDMPKQKPKTPEEPKHEQKQEQKPAKAAPKHKEEAKPKSTEQKNRQSNRSSGNSKPVYHNPPGSNAWVVHGNHTESGYPLLSSDPHFAHRIPGMFYLISYKLPDGPTLFGATYTGIPWIVIGRNEFASWGVTVSYLESVDLYMLERNRTHYQYNNSWVPLVVNRHIIKVKGGADVKFESYSTHHGPVMHYPPNPDIGGIFGYGVIFCYHAT